MQFLLIMWVQLIWAASWENQQNELCAQSDQSSLSVWRTVGSLATHWAHSEDSDQTGRLPRLIWIFAGRTGHVVGFVMRWLILINTIFPVYILVCLHILFPVKWFPTDLTTVRFLSSMDSLMFNQLRNVDEHLITKAARVQFLPTALRSWWLLIWNRKNVQIK